jgi:hypothetical protein
VENWKREVAPAVGLSCLVPRHDLQRGFAALRRNDCHSLAWQSGGSPPDSPLVEAAFFRPLKHLLPLLPHSSHLLGADTFSDSLPPSNNGPVASLSRWKVSGSQHAERMAAVCAGILVDREAVGGDDGGSFLQAKSGKSSDVHRAPGPFAASRAFADGL